MALRRSISVCAAPRAQLFSPPCVRYIATTPLKRQDQRSPFGSFGGASPPRLPQEEQDIFEELQRQSTRAFSTPRSPPKINQSPNASPADTAEAESKIDARTDKLTDSPPSKFKEEFNRIIEARGKGEELHPNVRLGAEPEFEGETNPKTGEIGGPKNEPLRWGPGGEWSYNGRTTDF